nr:MAG TPA: hypothetical protein [Caudoviricetes sp.]
MRNCKLDTDKLLGLRQQPNRNRRNKRETTCKN